MASSPVPTAKKWADTKIFTTGEAAEVCKVSQQTIIRCFDSGRLGGFRVPGSKFRRIPRADLIKFMIDNEIPIDVLETGVMRILVIDDEQPILELFQDLLGRNPKFDVRTVSSAFDAGIVTARWAPHLIIVDYMLPDVNGVVMCERIREDGVLSTTKIVITSGVVNTPEIDALIKAGADEFLKKPFNVQHLLSRLHALLGITTS